MPQVTAFASEYFVLSPFTLCQAIASPEFKQSPYVALVPKIWL
jgi:hypothetical protein